MTDPSAQNENWVSRHIGGINWTFRGPIPEGLVDCLGQSDALLDDPKRRIKHSRVVTIARVQTSSGRRLILRRINYGKLSHRLRDVFRPSRARRAFDAAVWLEQAGVPTARAIAVGERRCFRLPLVAYLVTEEIVDAVNLAQYLASATSSTDALISVSALLANMHAAGFAHRDLKLGNILLDPTRRALLIDLDGLRYAGFVPIDRAARDLARLWEGVSGYQIPSRAMEEFLIAYCQQRDNRMNPRELAQRIEGVMNHDNRTAAVHFPTKGTALANSDWVQLPGSGIGYVRRDWQPAFEQAGLRTVDHFLAVTGTALSKPGLGTRYRARLDLHQNGQCHRVYLKRFNGEKLSARLRRRLEDGHSEPAAIREARTALTLAELEIRAPEPIAFGWDLAHPHRQRSYVVSDEVWGESAEQWAQRQRAATLAVKKEVVRQIALLARKFHRAGWCHRDFYLCHIFVDQTSSRVRLSLIDLGRVFRPRWRRRRWRVKDLAQLNYSAQQQGVSTSLRMRFLNSYFDTHRLDRSHRRWLRQIIRKTRLIAQRQQRKKT